MTNGTLVRNEIVKVAELKPHSRNTEIYGDPRESQDFAAFVTDIAENGIHPLIVADDMTIIGGHRRYYAAIEIGLAEVPVAVYYYESEVDALAALIADNNQRIKSNWQVANEVTVLRSIADERAKQRQGKRNDLNNFPDTCPESKNGKDARDEVGEQLGISGRTADDLQTVKETVDELIADGQKDEADDLIKAVNKSARNAAKKARERRKKQKKQKPATPTIATFTIEQWDTLSDRQREDALATQGNAKFNETNDNVEWALWTWNPVTGCLHNCPYCYARDIANRFYSHMPDGERFSPAFYPERLTAPANTKQPDLNSIDDPIRRMGLKNVFTCSMADLFGKWVPVEWIHAVLKQAWDNPEWNFLFLTKFPIRMAEFEFPPNTWIGTTVDSQHTVERAEKAFGKIRAGGYEGVAWLSCEPMMERLTFGSLEMFDWVVMGGSSKSTQTAEFKPPIEWTFHLWEQAKHLEIPVYMKTNLGVDSEIRLREYPKV